MPLRPDTRFARAGGIDIAYQVFGDGPVDLVWVPGWISHLEYMWELPEFASFLNRLARFSRVIAFDKRGVGLSDRTQGVATLEERMDDVRAVMDAAGSSKAALVGWFDASALLALFAASFPERTVALVVGAATAKMVQDDHQPWGPNAQFMRQMAEILAAREWGTSSYVKLLAPSMAEDEHFLSWWHRYERVAATPNTAAAMFKMNADIDVRRVLATIRVPTLVIHRTGMRIVDIRAARWFAEQITGARFVELPGDDIFPYVGDSDAVLDEIEAFVTGSKGGRDPDRVLLTVLVTDIVGSTDRAAALGDRRWRELLDAHHREVRRHLARFGGQEIDTAGDGFLVSFDGPGRAVRCAVNIVEGVQRLGLEVRAGIHTGEVERREDGSLAGVAVHIAARIAALARPSEVLVSATVTDLVVGSGLRFRDREVHALKGVPGEWRLYGVEQ
jgi:class 3 adenylate cyclase